MNLMEDPHRVMADLRPAALDRLAEEGYQRHRSADLARAFDKTVAGTQHSRRLTLAVARRPPVLLSAVAGLAAAAVAAAVVITLPSPHGSQPTGAPAGGAGSTASTGSTASGSQAILLTAAHTAASRQAAAGTYWYVKERDFEPTAPSKNGPRPKGKAAVKSPGYSAAFAATQETWTSGTRTRTVVNEDLVFTFASAADKAKWQADGSPKLAAPAGSGLAGPVTSNYAFGYSYNIGAIKVSLATARKLPTTQGRLDSMLRKAWQSLTPTQQQGTVGLPQPTYAQYVFTVAEELLTGPVTPGTRAAVYGLLAEQPGLTTATNVTDPLGRVGTAIGDGDGDFLVISPATADVLDVTTYPARPGATIPAIGYGTEAYLSLSWTNQLP